MKKIVAVFLILAMMTVFVSCGDREDNSDDPTLNTNVGAPNIESTTAADPNSGGYVLTTTPDQTVPSGFTTVYIPTSPDEVISSSLVIPSISDQNTTTPTPSISQVTIPNTQPTTPTSNNNQTGPTVVDAPDNTTKPPVSDNQEPTSGEESKAEAKAVSPGSVATSNNGDILIDIEANGWDAPLSLNKGNVTIKYGSNTENVACSLSSTGSDYVITVYASKLDIYSGADVIITVPEGFLKTVTGTQYNRAFTTKLYDYSKNEN